MKGYLFTILRSTLGLVVLTGCYSQVTTIPGAAQRLRAPTTPPGPSVPVPFSTITPPLGPSMTPTITATPTRTPTATPTSTPTLVPTPNAQRVNPNPVLVAIGDPLPAGLGVNPTMVRLEFLRNNVLHPLNRASRFRFSGVPTHWIRFLVNGVYQPCVAAPSTAPCEKDVAANENALVFYMMSDASGNRTLTVTDITTGVTPIPSTTATVSPFAILYSLKFKKADNTVGPETFAHVSCAPRAIKIVASDFLGNPVNIANNPFTLQLENLGSAKVHGAAGCASQLPSNQVTLPVGTSSADLYFKDATVETINVTAKGTTIPAIASTAAQRVSFVEAVASVQITGGPADLIAGKLSSQTESFKVVTKNGNGVPFGGGAIVQLSSQNDPVLYHNDNGQALNPAQFTMPDNGEVSFRVKVTPDPNNVKGQTTLVAKVMNTAIQGTSTRNVLLRPIYSVIEGPESQFATTCTPSNGTNYTLLLKNFLDDYASDPLNDTVLQIANLGSAKVYRADSNCGLSKGNGDVADQPLTQLFIPKGVAQVSFRVKDDKAENLNLTVTGAYPLKDNLPRNLLFKRNAFGLHPDFGPQGKGVVLTNVAPGTSDSAGGIALQNGSFTIAVSSSEMGTLAAGLARFTPWGLLDNTLQSSGVLRQITPSFGVASELFDVATYGTDKLFAVGRGRPSANDDFVVARYQTSGSLDTTFSAPNGFFHTDFSSATDSAQHVEPLLVGTTQYVYTAGPSQVGGANPRGAVAFARYRENGLDPLVAQLPAAGNGDFAGVTVQVNALTPYKVDGVQHLIVAGALVTQTNSKAFLMMVEAAEPNALKLAASFDGPTGSGDGIVIPSFGGSNESFASVNALPNGDLIAAGTSSGNIVVAVFNPNGTFESTIENGAGYFVINLGAVEKATWAGIYQDPTSTIPKLLIAGSSKLNADPEKLLFLRVSTEGTLDSFAPNTITHDLGANPQSVRQCLIMPNGDLVCSVNANGAVGTLKLLY